jgi:hypothetical protein
VTDQLTIDNDSLRQLILRHPWEPGQPLAGFEAAWLRRYVARYPWRPGECGKGIVTPTGSVITWCTYDEDGEPDADGLPWHELVIRAMYPNLIGNHGDVRAAFTIDDDGSFQDRGELPEIERERITQHLAKLTARSPVLSRFPRSNLITSIELPQSTSQGIHRPHLYTCPFCRHFAESSGETGEASQGLRTRAGCT